MVPIVPLLIPLFSRPVPWSVPRLTMNALTAAEGPLSCSVPLFVTPLVADSVPRSETCVTVPVPSVTVSVAETAPRVLMEREATVVTADALIAPFPDTISGEPRASVPPVAASVCPAAMVFVPARS